MSMYRRIIFSFLVFILGAGTLEQRLGVYYESEVFPQLNMEEAAITDFSRMSKLDKLAKMRDAKQKLIDLKLKYAKEQQQTEITTPEAASSGNPGASEQSAGDGNKPKGG